MASDEERQDNAGHLALPKHEELLVALFKRLEARVENYGFPPHRSRKRVPLLFWQTADS
jgi:hypothetical protein